MSARRKLLVLDLVGLTPSALERAPRLKAHASGFCTPMQTVLPAVTCTAQASFLTGALPEKHGIVANGWYFRGLDEVWLWRQSRYLIEGSTLFDDLRRAGKRAANLFGWYNWNCGADWSITPKPSYGADGRKEPGIHTEPLELREPLERELGPFPLFEFWGPRAGIRSTEWIARSVRFVLEKHEPDLVFGYLPHLDYDHQRFGPDAPRSLAAIAELDRVAGDLCDAAKQRGYEILAFSEYGITDVAGFSAPNRALRREGYLRVRFDPLSRELPLFGTSRAFAVCDHQIAHVYVPERNDRGRVRDLLLSDPAVGEVLEGESRKAAGLDHPNSGELVALAKPDRWLAYPYWLDDAVAPDFARSVDIHRKPGYDPAELFLDPALAAPTARVAWTLLKKKLGFRYLMEVIPLDPSPVRGSHGLLPREQSRGPVLLGSEGAPRPRESKIVALRSAIGDFFGLPPHP